MLTYFAQPKSKAGSHGLSGFLANHGYNLKTIHRLNQLTCITPYESVTRQPENSSKPHLARLSAAPANYFRAPFHVTAVIGYHAGHDAHSPQPLTL